MWKKQNKAVRYLLVAVSKMKHIFPYLLQAKNYKLKVSAGFTLIELLLSVAMIAVLAGVSLPVYRTLLSKNDLDIAANTIVFSLRRSQLLSQAVDGDTSWGVNAQNGSIVIFKGASYASRDTAFDEIVDVPAMIGVGGLTEIVFAKFTGLPQTTGSINVSTGNDTRSVSINEKGTIGF